MDAKKTAIFLFVAITGLTFAFYYVDNFYASWAINPSTNWFLAVLAYLFLSQPIYDLTLILFTYVIYEQSGRESSAAVRGFIAAVFILIALDILSVPHSAQSLFSVSATTMLPNDPNLAPYEDWQILHALAPNGIITFWDDIICYVVIPTILNIGAFFLVSPEIYAQLVEEA